MVTGSSSCAKKYLEKFRKKIESQILQGMILRNSAWTALIRGP